MPTVAILIGNSDNKLSQVDYSAFAADLNKIVETFTECTHFKGGSDWHAPRQNACWVCDVAAAVIPKPEWPGDARDPAAGCWHVINGNWNAPAFDADYCRRPCTPGTRYCEQHNRERSA